MKVAIGLGSSLGDRVGAIDLAIRKLGAHPGLRFLATSLLYRSPPMTGGTARGWFVNAVALFECDTSLEELLSTCRRIEELSGRRRARHWGDRPIDLDILLADEIVLDGEELTLPHPGIGRRAFVLGPLLEVWPDAKDPRTGRRWAEHPQPLGPRPVPIGVLARRRPAL